MFTLLVISSSKNEMEMTGRNVWVRRKIEQESREIIYKFHVSMDERKLKNVIASKKLKIILGENFKNKPQNRY